jgi:hypothetical protein
MTIIVRDEWTPVGKFPDGSPILACWVLDNETVVGRIVDMREAGYTAEFINIEGCYESRDLPDYYSAVLFVASHAEAKKRRLH